MDHQLLIQNLKRPVVILNVDQGHFIDCNELALDFFQLSKKEILSKNPFELSPPNVYGQEAEAYSRQVIQEALAGGNPVFDWIHIDKGGNEIPCEVRLIRFPPFNKQLVRGTIIDKRFDDNRHVRESEERLRLSLEATDLGTFDWYPKEDKVFWDAGLFEIFEVDPKHKIDLNAHFFSLLHPEDQERISKEFEESLQPQGPQTHETEYRVVIEGRLKYLLAYSRMIRDDKGEVIRMLGTTQDITKLRESEERLKRSEQLFKSIVQDQEEMIVRWKPGGVRTFANRSYLETFNLKEEEVVGSSFFDLINEEDQKAVIEKLESLSLENPTATKIHRVYLPDGSTGWQEWTDRVLYDDEGNEIEYQSTGRDITEIVTARKALEESERRYRNVFNQQFQFAALLDMSGKIVQINDLPLQVQGVGKEDFIGKYFWKAPGFGGNRKHEQRVKDQLNKLNATKESLLVEDQYADPEGNTRYATSHYSLIKDNNGEIENILVQATDKTEIVESQKALEESEERYRNVFNQQFQFTALLDLDGKVLHINELPLKNQGLSKEDYLGKYFWESPGWSGNKEWEKNIKSQVHFVKKTGEPLLVEDPFYGKEKETRTAKASYSVLRNNDGEIKNILVQALDITAEKVAKKEVEESEKQLRAIYNNVSDFMALFRYDKGKFILESINSAFAEVNKSFGLNIEKDLLGGELVQNMRMFGFDEKMILDRKEKYDKVIATKEELSYLEVTKIDDYEIYGDSKLTPILNQEGKVLYVLWTSKDITENYLGQKKLEEAYKQVSELKAKLEKENIYLKEEIKQANDFENMVFKSGEFRGVLNKVEQVAKTDATVLITGETGTGKELIARAIHNVSKRSEKPMIKVNTAAIPKDLIESELFGHEKGAFTGASGEKPGKFELADGGTIFLDEIGDMPIDLQVKILRVLQEGEVERLGSNKLKKIDVRIISATNKDLKKAIDEGRFREDLYFRLNVFPIEIPPLRSRPDDIPILVEHFVAKYNLKHSKRVSSIPKTAMDYLRNYTWPGNVRELENTLERAMILTSSEILELPEVVENTPSQEQWEHDNALDVIQENHIRKVLKECNWKVEGEDGAAIQLKIKPSTLRDKMKKFNIKRSRK